MKLKLCAIISTIESTEITVALGFWSFGFLGFLRPSRFPGFGVSRSLGLWVFGSVGLWVFGSVGLWVFGSVGLWVSGFWVFGFLGL